MNTTLSFEDWLFTVEPAIDEIDYLYNSIVPVQEFPFYLKYGENTLILASEKAKYAFIKHLENKYTDGEDINTWIGFKKAIEKED